MNEEKTFSDILFKSTLAVRLINLVKPIVSSHLEQCLADKSLKCSKRQLPYMPILEQLFQI